MSSQDVFFQYANPINHLGTVQFGDLSQTGQPIAGGIRAVVQGATAVAPFSPIGKRISEIQAIVQPTPAGSPLETMTLELVRWPADTTLDPSAAETIASGGADFTGNAQTILVVGIDHHVDPKFFYALKLFFGDIVGGQAFLGTVSYQGRG